MTQGLNSFVGCEIMFIRIRLTELRRTSWHQQLLKRDGKRGIKWQLRHLVLKQWRSCFGSMVQVNLQLPRHSFHTHRPWTVIIQSINDSWSWTFSIISPSWWQLYLRIRYLYMPGSYMALNRPTAFVLVKSQGSSSQVPGMQYFKWKWIWNQLVEPQRRSEHWRASIDSPVACFMHDRRFWWWKILK
jgi:hypothetical protein